MASNPHYEGDSQAFQRVKENGKDVIIVKPKGLNIVWGKDDRYWKLPQEEDSPAELLQVCWLEVSGSVATGTSKNAYEVSFKVSLTPDAFGWGGSPIYVMAKRGKNGKFAWSKEILTNSYDSAEKTLKTTIKPNQGSQENEKLYFGLYEVWSGKWKGGLKIHSVTVKEI